MVNHGHNPASVIIGDMSGEALGAPVTLGVGDTLDFTVIFIGGVTGTFTGENVVWPLLRQFPVDYVSFQNRSMTLLFDHADVAVSGAVGGVMEEDQFGKWGAIVGSIIGLIAGYAEAGIGGAALGAVFIGPIVGAIAGYALMLLGQVVFGAGIFLVALWQPILVVVIAILLIINFWGQG